MTQREKLKPLLIRFCNKQDSRTFSLKSLHSYYKDYSSIGIGGNTPQATIRRLLQELREEGFLSFLDESGHYTLREIDLLDSEKEDLKNIIIIDNETPQGKEYLRETFIRNTKLVRETKIKFNFRCLIFNCQNTFFMPNKQPYIEVHHIVPLYKGGEDALWNLATVCAHHHRMAHFAEEKYCEDIQKNLLETNRRLLK